MSRASRRRLYKVSGKEVANIRNNKRYEREVLRFVENELYAYPWMEQELQELRADIIEAGYGTTTVPVNNKRITPGDPTLEKTIKLITSKRLKRLTESYEAISRVLARLDDDQRKFVQLKYWDRKLTDYGICQRLYISRRTLYNWRHRILRSIAEEMGLL